MKYLLLALLFIPTISFAKEWPVKYDVTRAEIIKYCGEYSRACFFPVENVILMDNADHKTPKLYADIYWHEIGHFYMEGHDYSQFFVKGWWGSEGMADGFSDWIQGRSTPEKVAEFYRGIYYKN